MENPPELAPGQELFFEAWQALRSDAAANGFSVPSIPWSSIRAYCDEHGIRTREQRNAMFYLVRAIDNAFVKHQTPKAPKPPSGNPETARGNKKSKKRQRR